MSNKRAHSEVPYQCYSRIKRNVLHSWNIKGKLELFIDPSFPPDKSSLTYVYSGDDTYDRTVFKRPEAINRRLIFACVGGILNTPFPWRNFQKKRWFESALVILSLCARYMEKVIPGYRNGEQNFSSDYIGAFRFNIWRFGEWIETIVDDNLPMLDDKLMFCPTFGDPPEYWAPLVEKAYAKIMKTYEAIESGDILDALTDFTGGICEYYTSDVNPPENLFYILFNSFQNRSFIVCWRNDKRLTPTGFISPGDSVMDFESGDTYDIDDRYLHIITAVSKFPMMDGRFVEVLRLKCPYPCEPKWHGKYSDNDNISWNGICTDFLEKYQPTKCKKDDEYWISLDDFRVNFGGLIICSNVDPYRPEGFGVTRKNACPFDVDDGFLFNSQYHVTNPNENLYNNKSKLGFYRQRSYQSRQTSNNKGEITVEEERTTVKVNTALQTSIGGEIRRHSVGETNVVDIESNSTKAIPCIFTRTSSIQYNMLTNRKSHEGMHAMPPFSSRVSMVSNISDNDSSFSTSDISLSIQEQQYIVRPKSAPSHHCSRQSSGNLSLLTQSNFLATGTDCFTSHGAWKQIIDYKSIWTQQMSGASIRNMDILSKNPRILLAIHRKETVNELIPCHLRRKSHVLISLLQEYRNGISTANTSFVHIGLAIFKTKHPEKDEKRNLAKLQLIFNMESTHNTRELKTRIDFDEGYYFVVPYCCSSGHQGAFLLRALDEKEIDSNKNGCMIS